MLFPRYPTGVEGFERWRLGHAINGPIESNSRMLMWAGGSLGWHSRRDRMKDEDCIPIDAVPEQAEIQARLAAGWNLFLGMGDDLINDAFIDELWWAGFHLGQLRRDGYGSGEAARLFSLTYSFKPHVPQIHALAVPDRVESEGKTFNWGLVYNDRAPDGTLLFLSAQTFREADARRLALCWNAAARMDGEPLRFGRYRQMIDLVANAGLAIALNDLKSRQMMLPKIAWTPDRRPFQRLLDVAYPLVRDRLESGAFALSDAMADAFTELEAIYRAGQTAPSAKAG